MVERPAAVEAQIPEAEVQQAIVESHIPGTGNQPAVVKSQNNIIEASDTEAQPSLVEAIDIGAEAAVVETRLADIEAVDIKAQPHAPEAIEARSVAIDGPPSPLIGAARPAIAEAQTAVSGANHTEVLLLEQLKRVGDVLEVLSKKLSKADEDDLINPAGKVKWPVTRELKDFCLYTKTSEEIERRVIELWKDSANPCPECKDPACKDSVASRRAMKDLNVRYVAEGESRPTEIKWFEFVTEDDKGQSKLEQHFKDRCWRKDHPEGAEKSAARHRDRLLLWWVWEGFDGIGLVCSYYLYDSRQIPGFASTKDDPGDTVDGQHAEYSQAMPWGSASHMMPQTIYGRIWEIDLRGSMVMPLPLLQFITIQTESLSSTDRSAFEANIGLSFAGRWSDRIPTDTHKYSGSGGTDSDSDSAKGDKVTSEIATEEGEPGEQGVDGPPHEDRDKDGCTFDDDILSAIFNIKWLDKQEENPEDDKWENGLQICRNSFLSKGGKGPGLDIRLREVTATVTLSMQYGSEHPFYNIVVLKDDGRTFNELYESDIMKQSARPRGRLACIAIFQNIVSYLLHSWATQWEKTIRDVSIASSDNINDALDLRWVREHMFDNQFVESARYLSALELLRHFSKLIAETSSEVDQICQAWNWCWTNVGEIETFSDSEMHVLETYCSTLRDEKEELTRRLLGLVREKEQQVEGIRQSALSASSLREARRSIDMNSYIFIFTVMTVFYLPLSFVTSLFGMNLFDNPVPSVTRRHFYIATVLISIVTYAFALLAAWIIAPSRQKKRMGDFIWKFVKWIPGRHNKQGEENNYDDHKGDDDDDYSASEAESNAPEPRPELKVSDHQLATDAANPQLQGNVPGIRSAPDILGTQKGADIPGPRSTGNCPRPQPRANIFHEALPDSDAPGPKDRRYFPRRRRTDPRSVKSMV